MSRLPVSMGLLRRDQFLRVAVQALGRVLRACRRSFTWQVREDGYIYLGGQPLPRNFSTIAQFFLATHFDRLSSSFCLLKITFFSSSAGPRIIFSDLTS